jgi:conjugative transfer signal peptidase TraF
MAIRIRDERVLRRMVVVFLLLAALQVLGTRFPRVFWLNLTDSEPVGLYRLHPLEGGVRRGEMVIMGVPEEFRQYVYGRGWLPKGWPLFKHVGAVAGDSYCVENGRFIVNGNFIGPVYFFDQEGKSLPKLEGCRQVPAGYFLPVATHISRSFDGRYMGAVTPSMIKGVATPILTFQ